MRISYKPTFIRQLNKLHSALQEEVLGKIEMLKDGKNHRLLKVHKLRGKLSEDYSFSVNYKTRIVFIYVSKQEIALLAIGDHGVYDE